MGLRSPGVPDMLEQDENHVGMDEDSSKESSVHSSLHDSSLTELEGKMAGAGIGAGGFLGERGALSKRNA